MRFNKTHPSFQSEVEIKIYTEHTYTIDHNVLSFNYYGVCGCEINVIIHAKHIHILAFLSIRPSLL